MVQQILKMADVVKASALLVEIATEVVRVPVTATKKVLWEAPCTEGAPVVPQDVSGKPT